MQGKSTTGLAKFYNYLKEKNSIFYKKEFNNFQKLIIMINIQYFLFDFGPFKFVSLDDLPKGSPFLESEKFFFDIVKQLRANSALYFFYLQINSSSGIDYISLDTWYKIKYIPLLKIKAHLMYSRHPFFFVYKKYDNRGAFINPQNLIINFNSDKDVGYDYKKSLVNEKDINNTVKVLFLKFHESAHSKFECGKKSDFSPRYLLNCELEKLDSHYDSIASYKLGKELRTYEQKGDDIREEGNAIEMFLYGNIIKTHFLMKYFNDLQNFLKTDLYTEINFKELNNLFAKHLTVEHLNLIKNYAEMEKKRKEVKSRNISTNIINTKENINQRKKIIKTPIYFFNNYPIEANY